MCVCVRERETERASVCVRETHRERVCVCERERERQTDRQTEIESVCV